jgi:hypothetical protein
MNDVGEIDNWSFKSVPGSIVKFSCDLEIFEIDCCAKNCRYFSLITLLNWFCKNAFVKETGFNPTKLLGAYLGA